jgi:hypothetical protein
MALSASACGERSSIEHSARLEQLVSRSKMEPAIVGKRVGSIKKRRGEEKRREDNGCQA